MLIASTENNSRQVANLEAQYREVQELRKALAEAEASRKKPPKDDKDKSK